MTRPASGDAEPDLDIEAWAERFSLLSAPTRLRLLAAMHQAGPATATVGELAQEAGISETAASHALRLLRLQGWVQDDRSGRSVRYTLTDPTIHELLHYLGATHD